MHQASPRWRPHNVEAENIDTFQLLWDSALQIRNCSNVAMFFDNNVGRQALILFDHIALEIQRDESFPATVAHIQ